MNTKPSPRTWIAALALGAAFAAPVAAQEVPFRFLPEPDFEQIIHEVVAPMKAKDAFGELEECAVADAKTLVPVTIVKAEQMIAPCIAGLGHRYGATLDLKRAASILTIYVPAEVALTSPLMKDLNHSLTLRQSRVLGHFVALRRGAAPSADRPGNMALRF